MRIIAAFVSLLLFSNCYPQSSAHNSRHDLQFLKSQILNAPSSEKEINIDASVQQSKKSPGLALLFSLIIPGSGHYYINRMDVGKYFFAADVASWLGYISLTVYGDNVNDDSKTYSVEHAQVTNTDNKNDDYWTNIGSYGNIYEYNNSQLQLGNYGSLYDVNQYYWDWDNQDNLNTYESQRRSSERIYNTRIVFGSLLIVNRVASAISAYLIASKQGKKSTSFNVYPELLYKNQYAFDGLKINLSKDF